MEKNTIKQFCFSLNLLNKAVSGSLSLGANLVNCLIKLVSSKSKTLLKLENQVGLFGIILLLVVAKILANSILFASKKLLFIVVMNVFK